MSAEVAKTSPGTTPQPIDQMWREMLPQLRTFVRRRIANPDRAEDLVAEIVLRIHQNVGTLDDQERLPNWVFGSPVTRSSTSTAGPAAAANS